MLSLISIRRQMQMIVAMMLMGLLVCASLSLYNQKKRMVEDREVKTQHLVESVYHVMQHYYQLSTSGVLSESMAKSEALKVIAAMRYGNKEYFWVNDTTPTMIMHPIKKELNGKDLSNFADPNGKKLFVEMVDVAKKNPEGGFVNYQWAKPGFDKPVDKVSYVKLFAPWNMIIGSGIYLDDIDEIFKGQATKSILYFALLGSIIFIISTIIARSILSHLDRLNDTLNRVATQKDFTQHLVVEGNNELSMTANAVNTLIESVRQALTEAKGVSQNNLELSSELQQTAKLFHRRMDNEHESVTKTENLVGDLKTTVDDIIASATKSRTEIDKAHTLLGTTGRNVVEMVDHVATNAENEMDLSEKQIGRAHV